MKSIKMTKEQYLEKHKELVDLLGIDMIEKRIQAEQDGLTVYQYGYIFALEKRITELEKLAKDWQEIACDAGKLIEEFWGYCLEGRESDIQRVLHDISKAPTWEDVYGDMSCAKAPKGEK